MAKGSCLCGGATVSYTGEPKLKALCHCTDCQKITGSAFSTNFLIPEENFSVSGAPLKEYEKAGFSGKPIISYFCTECGTTLYRRAPGKYPGMAILKAGVLEGDELKEKDIGGELFTSRRLPWVPAQPGANQFEEADP